MNQELITEVFVRVTPAFDAIVTQVTPSLFPEAGAVKIQLSIVILLNERQLRAGPGAISTTKHSAPTPDVPKPITLMPRIRILLPAVLIAPIAPRPFVN